MKTINKLENINLIKVPSNSDSEFLVRFVSYPGSGIHMLINKLNVLKIKHLRIYDLLFKIFKYKKKIFYI